MDSTLAVRLYRLALRLYPRRFRTEFGEEMVRAFEDGLRKVRREGWRARVRYTGKIIVDLVSSIVRERLAAMDPTSISLTIAAVICGFFVAYVDFHATEVQATLLVILGCNGILGFIAPRQVWRRALLVGCSLPVIHLVILALQDSGPFQWRPYLSQLLIVVPSLITSFIGAYAGVLTRYCWRQVMAAGDDSHTGPFTR